PLHERHYLCIRANGMRRNPGAEYKPLQSRQPTQCHIHLSRRKRSARIDNGFVKCKPLALVYGNGPGQPQGILRKCTQYLFLYAIVSLIIIVFDILPGLSTHHYIFGAIFETHQDLPSIRVYTFDNSDLAIEIFPFIPTIILDKHDLSPLLDRQGFFSRKGTCLKIIFYHRLEVVQSSTKALQLLLIDLIRQTIMRSQNNVLIPFCGNKVRFIIGIQYFQIFRSTLVVSDIVQYGNKFLILLSIYLLQFQLDQSMLTQNLGIEKERTGIMCTEHLPLVFTHDRGQLVQVTDKQDLQSAKRPHIPTDRLQYHVDHIQCICPYHGDLVYHEQFQLLQESPSLLGQLDRTEKPALIVDIGTRLIPAQGIILDKSSKWKPKQGVQRRSSGIHRRHARRCGYGHLLIAIVPDIPQKGGLTRTCLTCQKQVLIGLVDKSGSLSKYRIAMIDFERLHYWTKIGNFKDFRSFKNFGSL